MIPTTNPSAAPGGAQGDSATRCGGRSLPRHNGSKPSWCRHLRNIIREYVTIGIDGRPITGSKNGRNGSKSEDRPMKRRSQRGRPADHQNVPGSRTPTAAAGGLRSSTRWPRALLIKGVEPQLSQSDRIATTPKQANPPVTIPFSERLCEGEVINASVCDDRAWDLSADQADGKLLPKLEAH